MSNESQDGKRGLRRYSTQEAANAMLRRNGYFVGEDPQFQAGESPVEFVVNDQNEATTTDLGRNAHRGYVACDRATDLSAGNLTVELAEGDGTIYGDPFTLKSGEVYSIDGMNVAKIRLTHTGTDCGYRVNVR